MTSIHEYIVEGMTCEHCTASVSEEVGELAGVESVRVELGGGRLQVVGAVDRAAVAAAVSAAGYHLAS